MVLQLVPMVHEKILCEVLENIKNTNSNIRNKSVVIMAIW